VTAYRRGTLGHLVGPPYPAPWIPPPALVPFEDPWLMRRVLEGLRRL
jgi:hypothetical protein